MFLNDNLYCDICHLKILPFAEKNSSFGGSDRHYHNDCLKDKEEAQIRKYKHLVVITRIERPRPELKLANFEKEILARKDPVKVICRSCGKPIKILEEPYVAIRKEYDGNYKGCEIFNYHPACLSAEAGVKIYERADSDRHWYIFVSKNIANPHS